MAVAAAQGVLGEAQHGAGEPDCTGHRPGGQRAGRGYRALYVEELPDRGPEAVKIVDRPRPKGLVRIEGAPAMLREPAHVARDVGARLLLVGGLPEELALFCPADLLSRHTPSV